TPGAAALPRPARGRVHRPSARGSRPREARPPRRGGPPPCPVGTGDAKAGGNGCSSRLSVGGQRPREGRPRGRDRPRQPFYFALLPFPPNAEGDVLSPCPGSPLVMPPTRPRSPNSASVPPAGVAAVPSSGRNHRSRGAVAMVVTRAISTIIANSVG